MSGYQRALVTFRFEISHVVGLHAGVYYNFQLLGWLHLWKVGLSSRGNCQCSLTCVMPSYLHVEVVILRNETTARLFSVLCLIIWSLCSEPRHRIWSCGKLFLLDGEAFKARSIDNSQRSDWFPARFWTSFATLASISLKRLLKSPGSEIRERVSFLNGSWKVMFCTAIIREYHSEMLHLPSIFVLFTVCLSVA